MKWEDLTYEQEALYIWAHNTGEIYNWKCTIIRALARGQSIEDNAARWLDWYRAALRRLVRDCRRRDDNVITLSITEIAQLAEATVQWEAEELALEPGDPSPAPLPPLPSPSRMSEQEQAPFDPADVLRRSTIEGNALHLPAGDLGSHYAAVKAVIEKLGGHWDRKARAHVFPADPTDLLQRWLESGEFPELNPLAYFPTPADVAQRMWKMLEGIEFADALEPHAGTGELADSFKATFDTPLTVRELDEERARLLRGKGYEAEQGDFLTYHEAHDLIVMNPPFSVQGNPHAWADHILHGWTLARKAVVAVAPASVAFASTQKACRVRELAERYGEIVDLPAGSFGASGTSVSTCLVVLRKPADEVIGLAHLLDLVA